MHASDTLQVWVFDPEGADDAMKTYLALICSWQDQLIEWRRLTKSHLFSTIKQRNK